jgi:hypothetical protein
MNSEKYLAFLSFRRWLLVDMLIKEKALHGCFYTIMNESLIYHKSKKIYVYANLINGLEIMFFFCFENPCSFWMLLSPFPELWPPEKDLAEVQGMERVLLLCMVGGKSEVGRRKSEPRNISDCAFLKP